jgi:116 kDa U5 small nuclear ribonucleoprotein component
VLDPIYKIFAHTVGKDRPDLERFLARNLEIVLYPDEYLLNIKTLIKLIMKKYFGAPLCLAQSLIDHVPVPIKGAERLLSTHYRGSAGDFLDGVKRGSADGPLLINAVKMYHTKDYKTFYVLGRIISGTIKKNDRLRIMG